ncbi:hypothetical protein CACET_c28370 [Clostridium aceticum]|uniref:Uncharacterized protein n=1 Tax=Clostridium aceticum TaxID=84022 RepID=A0A0D8I9D9_9CLOT|nr:hypothetical protein [Clostridium aceticum]AKL96282.1 hypothetical protein CACET_c28370 [Clostridium aceticum]KJF26679.1 hypothetical protein TZ02_12535 [Clostridium aceticum]
MIKRIKVKLDAIEGMLYYWQSTNEREKVGEKYIVTMAEVPEMNYIYDDEFNKESVRKVLSAISNREILNSESKKERKFWNNNMWMLEDLAYTDMMIKPLKTLNLDNVIDKLNQKIETPRYEELEVIFLPGHQDEYLIADNKLFINFFRVKPDLYEENKVTIGDTLLLDYIEEKLTTLVSS